MKGLRTTKLTRWLFILFIASGLTSAVLGGFFERIFIPNKPPKATFIVHPLPVEVGRSVAFDATASHDPEGKALKYIWLVDGEHIADQRHFNHVFYQPGKKRVELIVKDSKYVSSAASQFIDVVPPRKVALLIDALTYYTYQMAWLGPHTEKLKFIPLELERAVDGGLLRFKYGYKGGKLFCISFDLDRKLVGKWRDGDGEGSFEVIFDPTFTNAEGSWQRDNGAKRWKMALKRR